MWQNQAPWQNGGWLGILMIKKVTRLYRAGTLGLAIKEGIGAWVSARGSRIGLKRVIYNSQTYTIFHPTALKDSSLMIH